MKFARVSILIAVVILAAACGGSSTVPTAVSVVTGATGGSQQSAASPTPSSLVPTVDGVAVPGAKADIVDGKEVVVEPIDNRYHRLRTSLDAAYKEGVDVWKAPESWVANDSIHLVFRSGAAGGGLLWIRYSKKPVVLVPVGVTSEFTGWMDDYASYLTSIAAEAVQGTGRAPLRFRVAAPGESPNSSMETVIQVVIDGSNVRDGASAVSNLTWSASEGLESGTVYFRSSSDRGLLGHELGHVLGLGHLPDHISGLMSASAVGEHFSSGELATAKKMLRRLIGTRSEDTHPSLVPRGQSNSRISLTFVCP